MDKIEKFFRNHKKQFNYLSADESDWEQVNSLLNPTSPKKVGPKTNRYRWVWAAAAAIILLIGYFGYQQQPNVPDANALATLIGLEESQYFPDLALHNPDGEIISLSSLNAQVVLVDFWASNCMVCNEENCYYFKPLYNEFRNKGFEIYSVSVDSSAINWINAIQRDGLDWIQVSDLKGFDSPVMEEYNVEALPTNYLLDQNGKIIAKNINVDELENRLTQLLAFY